MGLLESGTRRQPSLDERLTRGSRIQSHVQGDRGLARTLRTVLLCFSRHRMFSRVFTYIRRGGVTILRFLAILGSAAQVRIGTLDCKFDPGLQVWQV